MNNLTNSKYIELRDIILKSEGRPYVYCRCPDPDHLKGNDNSPITLDRVLKALGGRYGIRGDGVLLKDDYAHCGCCEELRALLDNECATFLALGLPLHEQGEEVWDELLKILG